MHHAEMARCLATCDVAGVRRLAKYVWPDMPQPGSDHEALAMIHHARTQVNSFAFKLRAYSHAWLIDHGYPSGLPDELKPKAERMFPRIVEGVGIACKGKSEIGRSIAPIIERAMVDVVLDAYAHARSPDPERLRDRMQIARARVIRKLFGKLP